MGELGGVSLWEKAQWVGIYNTHNAKEGTREQEAKQINSIIKFLEQAE